MFFRSLLFLILASSGLYATQLQNVQLQNKVEVLCEGFWPENELNIPVAEASIFALNQNQFNSVLDRVESFYSPVVAKLGGKLQIKRLWSDGTVNASAMRMGNTYQVNIYGGMARFHSITEEAFALVACHEVGHHLAGYPKVNNWMSDWASNEGQSDYFSGQKCFRSIYTQEENIEWTKTAEVNPIVVQKCDQVWSQPGERAGCYRFSMAGDNITALFKELKFPNDPRSFDTPDNSKVNRTFDGHPRPQCRLDTYFASALCDRSADENFSDDGPESGSCTENKGYSQGLRPRCWYAGK